MSQTTLDDDELFSEAASEMREDVEDALAEARATLPSAEDIWEAESDNTLGVLNALRAELDTADAAEHLRNAKKWYTMADRAGAFDDAAEIEEELQAIESLFERIEAAHVHVSELAAALPELRGDLEVTRGDGGTDGTDEDDGDG